MTIFHLHSWLKQGRIAVGGGLVAIALTACSTSPHAQAPVATAPPPRGTPVATLSPAPQNTSRPDAPPATSTAAPTTPTKSASGAEPSEQAAAQVIRSYYSAIARKDYPQAYSAWGNSGRDSQQSFEQFKQGFANTASTTVEVGKPGDPSGAAGSAYVEIPVTVRATTTSGTQQQFQGNYVLKRVNDVPGSTAAQRQWHLYSADLTPVG